MDYFQATKTESLALMDNLNSAQKGQLCHKNNMMLQLARAESATVVLHNKERQTESSTTG